MLARKIRPSTGPLVRPPDPPGLSRSRLQLAAACIKSSRRGDVDIMLLSPGRAADYLEVRYGVRIGPGDVDAAKRLARSMRFGDDD